MITTDFISKLETICNLFNLKNIAVYDRKEKKLVSIKKFYIQDEKIISLSEAFFSIFKKKQSQDQNSFTSKGCIEFEDQTICHYISLKYPDFLFIFFSNEQEITLNALTLEIEELLNHN